MFTRLTKMQIVAMWSLMAVLFGTGDLVAATLTGSGSNLPIPAPNPGGPPGVSPTLTVVTGAFTGVWTAPAQPPWVGTFSATGPVPNSSSTGTTSYDFTTLPTGVLPAGTFFLFNDVDYGSVTGETFDLRAWDTSASLITSPWLDEPIGVWGSGTGSGGAILPTNMPGWDWNSVNPSTYRIDGTSVSGGNPTVTFALVSNQPIATMELVKGSTFDSFGLQAPISVPEPASIGLACLGMLGLGIFAGRRRSGSCRGGSNMKTWITVAAIIVSGLLPGEAWAVQKEIFGLASESDGFHILRYDVTGNSFYDCGTVASSLKPTTNLAMDANRRLYYMDPFQGGHEIWKADLDGSNNLINQQYVNTLSQNLDIVDGFTIGPNQDLYMTGYGHSEIYRYDLGVNNGLVTTEVTLVAGPSGTVGEFRSDLAFDPLPLPDSQCIGGQRAG
jgi:hypothetical protein